MASTENKVVQQKHSPFTPTLKMSQTTPLISNKPLDISKNPVFNPAYVKPNVASYFSPKKPTLSLNSSHTVTTSTPDPFLSDKKTESPLVHSNSVIDLTGPEKKNTEDTPKKRFNLSHSKTVTNESNARQEGESPNKKPKTEDKKPENSTLFTYTPSSFGFGKK